MGVDGVFCFDAGVAGVDGPTGVDMVISIRNVQ